MATGGEGTGSTEVNRHAEWPNSSYVTGGQPVRLLGFPGSPPPGSRLRMTADRGAEIGRWPVPYEESSLGQLPPLDQLSLIAR